jgi:glycosyltransferase involved in cell wall biosynthesis
MPLRIAFDISELGSSQSHREDRRGINRVVEEVGGALAELATDRPSDFELLLTGVESSANARAYLASPDGRRLAASALLSTAGHRRWSAIRAGSHRFVMNTGDRAAAKRALRWLVYRTLPAQRAIALGLPAFAPEKIDVYHSPAFSPIPGYVRRARRPACFRTFYDLIPFRHPEMVQAISISQLQAVVAAFQPGDFAICISQHVKDDFCEYLHLDPSHVFVAPLAADAARFHPGADAGQIDATRRRFQIPDDGSPYLLSLCAVERRKNLLHLIRCFGRLRREDPAARDLRLVLVGRAAQAGLAETKSLIAAEKLEKHVVLTGYVEDADLAPLYAGALAFVFPSLAEGFGLPPLEAMQCGVPVICSDRTSLPEVMGDAGLLIDPEDPDALCAAMQRILHEEPLRAELSSRGLAQAARFSWERCAVDHLNAYRRGVEIKCGRRLA